MMKINNSNGTRAKSLPAKSYTVMLFILNSVINVALAAEQIIPVTAGQIY